MKVLVTGASGFVGRSVVACLLERGHGVYAISRQRPSPLPRFGVHWMRCDLADPSLNVCNILRKVLPDAIVHLAFHNPARGRRGSRSLLRVTDRMNERLLEACLGLPQHPLYLLASSGAVYGPAHPRKSLTERSPLSPVSSYGVGKVLAEMMAVQAAALGLPVIRARLFNVIGPGQEGNFVVPALARQIASIKGGLHSPQMKLMTPMSARDFTDVRDVAAGIALLLEKGRPGEVYNLCSGRAAQVSEVADVLLSEAGLKGKVDIRAGDGGLDLIPYQRGSAGKIRRLGWRPRYTLRRSLGDVWDFFWKGIALERPGGPSARRKPRR